MMCVCLDKASTLTLDICEDTGAFIQCQDPGYNVRIDNFAFGYMNTSCATNATDGDYENCTMAPGALSRVISLCEGRSSCWVEAWASIFGNTSCVDAPKTGRLTYTCQSEFLHHFLVHRRGKYWSKNVKNVTIDECKNYANCSQRATPAHFPQ